MLNIGADRTYLFYDNRPTKHRKCFYKWEEILCPVTLSDCLEEYKVDASVHNWFWNNVMQIFCLDLGPYLISTEKKGKS